MAPFLSDLRGRTAVVTGGAMGMGRMLALRLAKEGCHLALCDIALEELQAVKSECEAIDAALRVTAHQVDVSQREQVSSFRAYVVEAHGDKIHMLFNNAGIMVPQAWDLMSEDTFDKVLAVNLGGTVTTTRAFWPHLVAADAAMVVNMSSVACFLPAAAGPSTPYAVSKHAVRGFSEHLMWQAQVIAPHVKVAVVHMGPVLTEMMQKNMNLSIESADLRFLRRYLTAEQEQGFSAADDASKIAATQYITTRLHQWGYTPEQAADMIVVSAKAGKTRIMVGWDAVVVDAWLRLLPRAWLSPLGCDFVMISAVIGRHLVLPIVAAAGIVGVAVAAASVARRRL